MNSLLLLKIAPSKFECEVKTRGQSNDGMSHYFGKKKIEISSKMVFFLLVRPFGFPLSDT